MLHAFNYNYNHTRKPEIRTWGERVSPHSPGNWGRRGAVELQVPQIKAVERREEITQRAKFFLKWYQPWILEECRIISPQHGSRVHVSNIHKLSWSKCKSAHYMPQQSLPSAAEVRLQFYLMRKLSVTLINMNWQMIWAWLKGKQR